MNSIISAVRDVLGFPPEIADSPELASFIIVFEYLLSGLLLLVVVASIFKIIVNFSKN